MKIDKQKLKNAAAIVRYTIEESVMIYEGVKTYPDYGNKAKK